MSRVLKFTSSLAGLALAACVSSPEPVVVSSGTLPRSGTFAIGEASLGSELSALVSQRLQAKGLRAASEPLYLVQTGSFARPAAVGLFVPDANEEQWHRGPAGRRHEEVHGLIVSVTEKDSGREVYRVTAEQAARESQTKGQFPDLVAAAFDSALDKQDPTERP